MILNTRPLERQADLERVARDLGQPLVSCPVLETHLSTPSKAVFGGVDALVMTSRTALAAAQAAPRALPVYAVGPATAAGARNAGFLNVIDGGGTAETLLQTIDQAPFKRGLYLSARHVSCDLAAARPERLRRLVAYEMIPANDLAPRAIEAIAGRDSLIVPFYSPRSLTVFESLASTKGLSPDLKSATAIFIHDRLLSTSTLSWGGHRIASSLDGDGMAAAIKEAA